jgi:hypothetical protein
VVLEVGEEEPGGVMKTMRGRRHPAPREVGWWKPVTSSRGDGDDRVQRRYGRMGRRGCRGAIRCSGVRTTSNIHAGEGTLVAGGEDQRQRRYGPKGQRSGSPMLKQW